MTNVYLMKDNYTGFYKIGRSVSPAKREKTLLAQAPSIELICYWEDDGFSAEPQCHKLLAPYRQRGEWFLLDDIALQELYAFVDALPRTDVIAPSTAFLSNVRELTWRRDLRQAVRTRQAEARALVRASDYSDVDEYWRGVGFDPSEWGCWPTICTDF